MVSKLSSVRWPERLSPSRRLPSSQGTTEAADSKQAGEPTAPDDKYLCYKCGEDVTAMVVDAKKGPPGYKPQEESYRLLVTCTKGDQNIFPGEYKAAGENAGSGFAPTADNVSNRQAIISST